jgi:hypothetical protein
MEKHIILSIILLISTFECVNQNNYACPSCSSPTFVVALLDTNGSKLNGFTIKLISAQNETLSIVDTSHSNGYLSPDTMYELYGGNGICKLIISNEKYKSIEIDNLSISHGRCGVNPRMIRIEPKLNKLAKRSATSYKLLLDSTGLGCGN